MNCYVAQTVPQRERFAVENLIEAGISANAIWLPEHDGRLFVPGYLFIESEGRPIGVRDCEGILRLLPSWHMPIAVSADEMAVLREVCRAAAQAMERHRAPQPGDHVEVVSGPLRDWRGIVELTQKRMLKVLLPLFGSVTLHTDQVVQIAHDADPWGGEPSDRMAHRRKRGHRLSRAAALSTSVFTRA